MNAGFPNSVRISEKCKQGAGRAFTLVEVLVASAVLILLLMVLFSTVSQTSSITRRATEKISSFQGARFAFESITRTLGQATLNSYWDYDNPNSPMRYLRKSELHFLVGQAGTAPFPGTAGTGEAVFFQAPAGVCDDSALHGGLESLLNACGYYVQYGSEPVPDVFQGVVAPKYRYRLMQAVQPTESLSVYGASTGSGWVSSAGAIPLADNIIYLVVWPRKSRSEDDQGQALTTDFSYDSRSGATDSPQPETANQLPPLVQITFVAIDESSAAQLCTGSTPPSKISAASSGLFTCSNQIDFANDLGTFEGNLAAAGIKYQVFTSLVPIRESKMQ